MHSFESIGLTGLRTKILLLFVLILIVPLSLLMFFVLRRTDAAAKLDFNRRLGYATNLFRKSLDDQLVTMKIRVKTVADFDFFTAAGQGFAASSTQPLLKYELVRSDLDFICLVKDRSIPFLEEGVPPLEALPKVLPGICHMPLTANLYILEGNPWIFTAAEITKLRGEERYHVVFAYRLARDFGDRLKPLTGAELSLLYAGKRVLTTLMDIYGKRQIGQAIPQPDQQRGSFDIMGIEHAFVREELLPGKISGSILLETSLPAAEITGLTERMSQDFLLFGTFGIILALVTGTVLAFHIATPVKQLAESTTRVAAGESPSIAVVDRNDEIGLLTKNFESMVNSLQAERTLKMCRMRELNTLFEISNAVNFITDSEELLKFVLTHAIDILEAERGSIMLLDDQTDELVVKVAFGGRYRLVTGTPVKLGHGICGLVAQEGIGRISNAGFRDQAFKNFGSLLPVEDIKTLLCSPLKFKEGTIGVINIVNKRDGAEFGENDLALLNLIASQAAVTIENNKLYELSITDGLTRLYVHRYFQARISEELLRARRYGLKCTLIMIDIDNFKNFNDVYGHQIGDQVLQRVALAIRDTIRTGIDVPCRYGGEEMAIILPETRAEEAHITAERIRESIAAISLSHPMGNLRVTASLGLAGFPSDAHDREALIQAADEAMYHSKHSGKNRTTRADQLRAETT